MEPSADSAQSTKVVSGTSNSPASTEVAVSPDSSASGGTGGKNGGSPGSAGNTGGTVMIKHPVLTIEQEKEQQKLQEFMDSFWYKRFPKKCLKCWHRCWRAQRPAGLLLAFIFLGLDVTDMVADIIVTAEARDSEPAWKTALVIACFQGAVCLMASFYSTIRGALVFGGCKERGYRFGSSSSVFSNSDASVFWKNMVKIIPVATEDFLSSYAIVGINAQSGNESLTFFQAASLLLAGLKCIFIGVTSGWIAITSPKKCIFLNLFITIFAFLECAVCFVMGGILIFLAVVQDISGEYRFIFLAATLFGWASSFSLIYTSFLLRKVFTMSTLKSTKVEPWKMPIFYVFLLFPGLAVPIIEEYSPEFLFRSQKAAKGAATGDQSSAAKGAATGDQSSAAKGAATGDQSSDTSVR